MILRLTVTNTSGDFAGHVSGRDFDESGGTIGRSSQNDWVLPDPKKLVSGRHAEIRFEQGGFFIIDTGTNGIFLNGSDSRIGKGQPARLRNADRVRMGEFELVAEIEEGGLTPWPDQAATEASGPPIPEDCSAGLSGIQSDIAPDSRGSVADIGGLRDPPGTLALQESQVEHAVSANSADGDSPPTHPTTPWSLGGGARLDETPAGQTDWAEPAESEPTIQVSPFRYRDRAAPVKSPINSREPPPQSATAAAAPAPGWSRVHEEGPETPPPRHAPDPTSSVVPANREPHPPVRAPAGPAGSAAAEGLEAALTLILEGAGLPDLRIPGGAGPDWFRTIGQIIGIYAAASAELLQTISAIKDTFSIHQTQIRGRDNNPLRWATPRQAVKRLLAPDEDGFLGPAAAVADTIAGIKGHQMGAIKGMEAAFKAFLLDLDPTKLARDFEAHGAPGILANKKAWYWDQYAKSYQRLTESARENYLDLLGDAFSEAYEAQVRIIREEAKKTLAD